MQKKLTITVDPAVYEGLHRVVGHGRISAFLNDLARPHVVPKDLQAAYRAMSRDEEHEREALEWAEGTLGDADD